MKKVMVCGVLMLRLAAAGANSSPGFEGKWIGAVPGPNGQGSLDAVFTLHLDGSEPSGTVDANGQTFALVNLKIDGSTIAFAIEGEEQNKYRGVLDGDRIKMQVTYHSNENGDRTWSFVLSRRVAASAADIDGEWTGDVPRGGDRTIPARFTFHTEGTKLSGTANAVGEDFSLHGTIDGDTIAFSVDGTVGSYSGQRTGDEIRMTVKYDGGETGRITLPFVLKRAG